MNPLLDRMVRGASAPLERKGALSIPVPELNSKARQGEGTRETGRKKPRKTIGSGGVERSLHARGERVLASILAVLDKAGHKYEQLAIVAGAAIAKEITPVPLTALALIAGYVLGRQLAGKPYSQPIFERLIVKRRRSSHRSGRGGAISDRKRGPG
jgi:hypothetical protein